MDIKKAITIGILQIIKDDQGIFGLGSDSKIYTWVSHSGGFWQKYYDEDQVEPQGAVFIPEN